MRRWYGVALTVMLVFGVLASPGEADKLGGKGIDKCQTIDEPGAYFLKDNLSAKGNCLVIVVDHVTIDFNGFRITGNGTGNCVWDNDTGHEGIVIKNGTVTNCYNGIYLPNTNSCKIEEMRVLDNASRGIQVNNKCIIKNNLANNNGWDDSCRDGIEAEDGNVVVQNVASNNCDDGIDVSDGNVIQSNAAREDGDNGIEHDCDNIEVDNAGYVYDDC